MKAVYVSFAIVSVLMGILMLLSNSHFPSIVEQNRYTLSFAVNALGILLFILSPQPYAAGFLFVLLAIKAFLLKKIP